jgi:predicted TIM-barrel fold metal-dependent hydrolase
MHSFIDCILSGLYDRFPNLITMCSEGTVGWMPYILQRLDEMWLHENPTLTGVKLSQLPSSYMKQIYGCIVDDEVGLSFRDRIGMDQICFETDYPHAASLWPDSAAAAERLIEAAGLDDDETYKFLRGNAIKAFRLDSRMGIMS